MRPNTADIQAWVKDEANFKRIMSVVTLANPITALIRKLVDLGVPFDTLKALKNGSMTDVEFQAQLPGGLDIAPFGGNVAQWVRDNFDAVRHDSDVEDLEFRYADPDAIAETVRPIEFIRLALFIRLWKKLGWTIAYTDKAIAALYPKDQIPGVENDDQASRQKLAAGFLDMLPRLGVVRRAIKALKRKPQSDLLSVLALFSPIDAHGGALLSPDVPEPVAGLCRTCFRRGRIRHFLQDDSAASDLSHTETLRAAFGVTDEELRLIADALSFDADTPLTLDSISAVFRTGWLARALKLSARIPAAHAIYRNRPVRRT